MGSATARLSSSLRKGTFSPMNTSLFCQMGYNNTIQNDYQVAVIIIIWMFTCSYLGGEDTRFKYFPFRAHLALPETLLKCRTATNLSSKGRESNQSLDFSLISSLLHVEDVAFVIHCSVVNLRGEWWPYTIWLMLWLLNVYRSAFISIPFDHWVIQLIFFEHCTFFFSHFQ